MVWGRVRGAQHPVSGVSLEVWRAGGCVPSGRRLLDSRLLAARSLYRRDLLCHYGCVNAIEFSAQGHLLLSGGDDRRVMLWNFDKTLMERSQPEPMLTQHFSNIFCLAITNDNLRIFSGGNDDQVIVHDTPTKRLVEVLPHQKAVCGIAIDPFDSRVLATAGNDGRLLVFDTRQSVDESLIVSRSRKAFHAVAFHPVQAGIIVAANARNGAALWDLRKPKHAIIKYGSGSSISQNCMSVRFDKSGDHILALRRRLPPVLYSTHSSEPRAFFYHPDYYNSCTMKSCCFAGDRDQFVLSGSDDFNLYMWKVPDTPEKTWVDETHLILYGHRSIVNQVRYNSEYSVIASSGVEKVIKLWSPIQIPGSKGSLLEEQSGPDNPRDVFSHEDYVSLVHHSGQYISHNYTDQSTSEDPRMMAFFDSLVQREFEGWSTEETDSQSGDDGLMFGVGNVRPANRSRRAAPPPPLPTHNTFQKDSDSSDSDQMLIHFLPKRVSNGVRTQRCQNRIARLIATRQSKLLRLAQKRIAPRCSKTQQGSSSVSCVSKRTRAPRPLRARRGIRRGGPSPPLILPTTLANTSIDSPASDSDLDSDTPSPRSLHRHMSKMTRPNRRRMNMPRGFKRKNKSSSYRVKGADSRYDNGVKSNGSHLHESGYSDDNNLAIPSTSTGIRGHHNAALFRITEADSDDDQSAGSCPKSPVTTPTENPNLPLVNILPTPINGSHETVDTHQLISWENNSSDRLLNYDRLLENDFRNSNESLQLDLQSWDRPRSNMVTGYTPTLTRLRNETNESEVESSCSTRSTADDICTPNKQLISANLTTPESGIHSGPCTSSGSRATTSNSKSKENVECSDEPEWVATKHRQRVKRARRNYRNHVGDSDST
ncbi:DDB1- and CUL4-associated factor 5 [Arctopsyche grandis]|uniref:DDB1- and CUL4-associated factor 5 n=1 Tax=Arctopsyche grandis TaxID=121162 RepID=UPI00406D8B5A